MKNKIWVLGLSLLFLINCRTHLQIANVKPEKNTFITSEISDDPASLSTINPYKVQLEGKMNEIISYTDVDLNKIGDNSNLGNLLADFTFDGAQDWAKQNATYQVDAAVINIGGIRSTIGKGNITIKQVYEVMPFENEVVIMKMSGDKMQGLFNYYLETHKNNPVSKLYIETNGNQMVKALINGTPIDKNKTYYIATSDYLAQGGDNMKFFQYGEIISTGIKLRDLFIKKFREYKKINPPDNIRLILKK